MKWTDTAALVFFGVCTLLTLGVSLPATYAALALFHDDGGAGGPLLAAFALLVFELGAVGAKLTTLVIPEWRGRLTLLTIGLLTVTTGANYAHGYDLSQVAEATPTLAAVLADPAGAVLATLATAALFPALLFVFLSAFVARAEALAQGRHLLARIRRIVARARARVAARGAELAGSREALAQSRAELAAAHTSLAETRAELAQSRAEVAQARLTLADVHEDAAQDRAELARLRPKLAQYEGWLAQAQHELERERSRPVLTVESALTLLVERKIAPESTVRGWEKRLTAERSEG